MEYAGDDAAVETLLTADTETEVFAAITAAATSMLPGEVALVASVDGETVTPEWVDADRLYPRSPLECEHGVAVETVETGSPVVVDDLRDRVADPPGALRSALSAPVPETGVLQVLSPTVGAYTDGDGRLARLLGLQAAQTLERVASERAARRERDEFAALFENVTVAALRYRGADGPTVERVNTSFVDTFGVESETVVGRSLAALPGLIGGDDATTANEWLPADGGTIPEHEAAVRGEAVKRRVTRPTPSGERRFLVRTVPVATAVEGASGTAESTGYVLYTDVEDRLRREERLQRQNDRLEEFASVVSHDLRNPLEVADGYLEVAREADDPEAAADAFGEVDAALDRMDRIVDDVLTLAREGETVVETAAVDLGATAETAWENVVTGEADLVVRDRVTVAADRSRLVQVLENLFRNAVQHAGPAVSVTVGHDGDGLLVADDGPGLTADEPAEALEPGYTTDTDGTGFGLAIVDRLSEAHGWTVTLGESEAGGLRVTLGGVPVVGE